MNPIHSKAVVLLTGASSGIGEALARELAPRVAGIALVARRQDRLVALARELEKSHPALRVGVFPCDLCDDAAVDALPGEVREELGSIDLLINNAGLGYACRFAEADQDRLQQMIHLNISAVVRLTRLILPDLIERGQGGVFNVSSVAGHMPVPKLATYSGTKHFISGWTEGLRAEVHGTGVYVGQLCPGPVDTEFSEVAGRSPEERRTGAAVLTATQCAQEAVAGLVAATPIVVPGMIPKIVMLWRQVLPWWMLRLVIRRL